jgi:hypothetical protein
MTEIIEMPRREDEIEVQPIKLDVREPTPEQIEQSLSKIEYKPSALVWKNFRVEQPDVDRWFVLWCPMGRISTNLFMCYRDGLGNYDLPHPTKRYNAFAWAYIDNPEAVPAVQ